MAERDPARAEAAAALLLEIRRTRARPRGLPAHLTPHGIEEASAIQDRVVARLGGIGGWKIVHPPPGAAPRCSPVPASVIHASGAAFDWDALLWPEVEVEIALQLGQDLPPRARPYAPDEAAAAVARMTVAFEVLGSRFADRTAVTRDESLADLLSCAAVVTGTGDAAFAALDCADVAMTLRFDDAVVGSAAGGPSTAEVLGTLTWLANHACTRAGGLRAGQVVITGARIHPLDLPRRGTRLVARAQGLGEVVATLRGAAGEAEG